MVTSNDQKLSQQVLLINFSYAEITNNDSHNSDNSIQMITSKNQKLSQQVPLMHKFCMNMGLVFRCS